MDGGRDIGTDGRRDKGQSDSMKKWVREIPEQIYVGFGLLYFFSLL
jgi:hypothetical protein